jgi:hypothetical protein
MTLDFLTFLGFKARNTFIFISMFNTVLWV